MTNPVKIKHRVFDNNGEKTRFEYDANILREFTYTTNKRMRLEVGDATRLLISCDEEAEFVVRLMEYLGDMVDTEINVFPKNTLAAGTPICCFATNTALRAFNFSLLNAMAEVDTPAGIYETISTNQDGDAAGLYRVFHTKQLLIDVPLFCTNSSFNELNIEIENLSGGNQRYKIYLLEEI